MILNQRQNSDLQSIDRRIVRMRPILDINKPEDDTENAGKRRVVHKHQPRSRDSEYLTGTDTLEQSM